MKIEMANDAPHLPPRWWTVERKKDKETGYKRRAESVRGGQVQTLCWASGFSFLDLALK